MIHRQPTIDVSALSPREFEAYQQLIDAAQDEVLGQDADWSTLFKWLSKRVVIPTGREAEVLSFFQSPSIPPTLSSFLALLRLISHSVSCSVLCKDHIFIQTDPLEVKLSQPTKKPISRNPFSKKIDNKSENETSPNVIDNIENWIENSVVASVPEDDSLPRKNPFLARAGVPRDDSPFIQRSSNLDRSVSLSVPRHRPPALTRSASPPPVLEGGSGRNPFKTKWTSPSNSMVLQQNPKSPPLPPRPNRTESVVHSKEPQRRATSDELSRPTALSPLPSPPKRKKSTVSTGTAPDLGVNHKISSTTTIISSTSAPSALPKANHSDSKLVSSSHLGMQTKLRTTSHPSKTEETTIQRARSDSSASGSVKYKPSTSQFIYASPAPAFPTRPETSKRGFPPTPPIRRKSTEESKIDIDPLMNPLPHSSVFVSGTQSGLSKSKTTISGKPSIPPPPPKRRPDSLHAGLVAPTEPTVPPPGAGSASVAHLRSHSSFQTSTKEPASNIALTQTTNAERKHFRESVKDFASMLESRGQPDWIAKAGQKIGVMPGARTEKQGLMTRKKGKLDEDEDEDDSVALSVGKPNTDFTDGSDDDLDRERERMRSQRETGWSRLG